MTKVYVCSPLHNEDKMKMATNQLRAQHLCNELNERYGYWAVAPHAWLPYMLDDNNSREREIAIDFGLKLLLTCDKLMVCSKVITAGMAKEIGFAREHNIPVENYQEVYND